MGQSIVGIQETKKVRGIAVKIGEGWKLDFQSCITEVKTISPSSAAGEWCSDLTCITNKYLLNGEPVQVT